MADSIFPNLLPDGMDAYLGYVDGAWPDYLAIAKRFGSKPCYGLSVFGNPAIGDGVDSEPGDASIFDTVIASKAELARGVAAPIVYCPASWGAQMVAAHDSAGVNRKEYRLLLAHYAGEHICGPATCGYEQADGTQWVDHGGWDESLLADNFLVLSRPPLPPTPVAVIQSRTPIPGENMAVLNTTVVADPDGNGWVDINLGGSIVTGGPWVLCAQPGTPAPDAKGDLYDHAHAETCIGAPSGAIRVQVCDGVPGCKYGVHLPVAP